MSKEAMKQALEALEKVNRRSVIMGSTGDYREGQLDALEAVSEDVKPAITALKEALAQPEQEPVAHLWQHGETGRTRVIFPDSITDCDANWFCVGPLVLGNTTPPQRTEQNFCSRCGKRTPDLTTIHTCTPPQENP